MAGTILPPVRTAFPDAGMVRYAFAWTSDASGDVNGHTADLDVMTLGTLHQVRFFPVPAAGQPSDLYDVALIDADGVDMLSGQGANLSNSISVYVRPTYEVFFDDSRTLDLVVTNAGASKSGFVYLWFRL